MFVAIRHIDDKLHELLLNHELFLYVVDYGVEKDQ